MQNREPTPTTDQIFADHLRLNHLSEERLQEILRRMCRSLTDAQGNLLSDFLFVMAKGKDRLKIHRRFLQLLDQELDNQHEHQGRQDPPYRAVKVS